MGKIRGEIGGEITGTVGDVTITVWKGIKVAKRKGGPSAVPPSQAQMQQRNRFLLASNYAKEVGADRQKRALYETLAKGQPTTWRALAIQDYLTPPIIVRVDVDQYTGKAGERIDVFRSGCHLPAGESDDIRPSAGRSKRFGRYRGRGRSPTGSRGAGLPLGLSDND